MRKWLDTCHGKVHDARVPSRYVPLSRPPRGAWARHIQAKRREWGWSQQHAFERLRDGLHLGPKSRASYVKIDEGGRQPTEDEAAYLASVFGWPEDEAAEPPAQADAILTAVNALVQELREERAALLAALSEQGRVIAVLLARLQGLEESQISTLLAQLQQQAGPSPLASGGNR